MPRRLEGRDGDIWRWYARGMTQEALATKYGITQERVSQIIKQINAQMPEVDISEQRTKLLDSLDDMGVMVAEIADLPPAQAYSNGRPMVNEDGSPILDYGTKMAATDRFLKIAERRAKILGLDAAVKAEVTVNERAREQAQEAAAAAISRLNEDE